MQLNGSNQASSKTWTVSESGWKKRTGLDGRLIRNIVTSALGLVRAQGKSRVDGRRKLQLDGTYGQRLVWTNLERRVESSMYHAVVKEALEELEVESSALNRGTQLRIQAGRRRSMQLVLLFATPRTSSWSNAHGGYF